MKDKIARALHETRDFCGSDLKETMQQWHDFLNYQKNASPHTIYNYILDLKTFFSFLVEHIGTTVTHEHLKTLPLSSFRSFLAHQVRQASSAKSNKRALSAIRNLYEFLYKQEGIKNIHLAELTSPKAEKTLPRPMTHMQTTQLMSLDAMYANQAKWLQLRDESLFMLLYGCGLRLAEALSLDIRDLNSQTLRVTGKRAKERMVPMLPLVYDKIQQYITACPAPAEPNRPLFIGIKGDRLSPRVVQKHLEKIRLGLGLPSTATPHSLRHSYASHLLAAGADLRSIQELMGHDSLSSTQVYTKLEDQELFKTYMTSHPRAKA